MKGCTHELIMKSLSQDSRNLQAMHRPPYSPSLAPEPAGAGWVVPWHMYHPLQGGCEGNQGTATEGGDATAEEIFQQECERDDKR